MAVFCVVHKDNLINELKKFCCNEHIDVRKCVRYNKEKEMIA